MAGWGHYEEESQGDMMMEDIYDLQVFLRLLTDSI